MSRARTAFALLASALLSTACSQIVGIEDRTGTWCTIEEASHDFCEDFDREDPFGQWDVQSGAAARVDSSDRSEPNALLAESGVALSRPFEEPFLSMELDLRIEPGGTENQPDGHDHAVAVISRSSGDVGLFVDPMGTLYFGFVSSIPAPIAVSAVGRWVRFGISVHAQPDATIATLEIEGAGNTEVKWPPQPRDPEKDEGRTTGVLIGAQKLFDTAAPVRCMFDNVTVDAGTEP